MPNRLHVLAVVLVLSACSSGPEPQQPTKRDLMRAELAPIEFGTPSDTPLIREHYARMTRGVAGARHDTGTFRSLGGSMVLHHLVPAVPGRGTVIAIHGYLAHPLQLDSLVRALLAEGFTVVAPELPGHALSDGERGAIATFADYGRFLADVLLVIDRHVPDPLHAVGHSTGASTIYEHLLSFDDPFAAVVFVAPLVRSRGYTASRVGRTLLRPFVARIGTGYEDPLGVRRMPLSWFDAQVEWNRALEAAPTLERPVLLLQGDDDSVVDWQYNLSFLKSHFANLRVEMVTGGGHVLFREEPQLRRRAVDLTLEEIRARE